MWFSKHHVVHRPESCDIAGCCYLSSLLSTLYSVDSCRDECYGTIWLTTGLSVEYPSRRLDGRAGKYQGDSVGYPSIYQSCPPQSDSVATPTSSRSSSPDIKYCPLDSRLLYLHDSSFSNRHTYIHIYVKLYLY